MKWRFINFSIMHVFPVFFCLTGLWLTLAGSVLFILNMMSCFIGVVLSFISYLTGNALSNSVHIGMSVIWRNVPCIVLCLSWLWCNDPRILLCMSWLCCNDPYILHVCPGYDVMIRGYYYACPDYDVMIHRYYMSVLVMM